MGECELVALLATNHWPPTTRTPPARIATCVFGVSPDLYIADRDEGVFVPQTLRFGGLWLGVAVYCRSGQDAGVELESSRDRQRWHLQEFNLTFRRCRRLGLNLALSPGGSSHAQVAPRHAHFRPSAWPSTATRILCRTLWRVMRNNLSGQCIGDERLRDS